MFAQAERFAKTIGYSSRQHFSFFGMKNRLPVIAKAEKDVGKIEIGEFFVPKTVAAGIGLYNAELECLDALREQPVLLVAVSKVVIALHQVLGIGFAVFQASNFDGLFRV